LHQLTIEGSYNVRDLGGYPTSDGHFVREKTLIRAGNLDHITAAGQQQLIDYGVKTIIDLRDTWETQRFPDVFAQSTAVTYLNIPFLGDKYLEDEDPSARVVSTIQDIYCIYLDHCQEQIGAIISAIAEATPSIVFHCHAGKDRTGLIAALVLGAIGVEDSTIAEDYAQTTLQADRSVIGIDWSAEPETMLGTLNYLQANYGGVANYLQLCGLSGTQLQDMQARFVV
jgi:protein-tyrosine phosphatase